MQASHKFRFRSNSLYTCISRICLGAYSQLSGWYIFVYLDEQVFSQGGPCLVFLSGLKLTPEHKWMSYIRSIHKNSMAGSLYGSSKYFFFYQFIPSETIMPLRGKGALLGVQENEKDFRKNRKPKNLNNWISLSSCNVTKARSGQNRGVLPPYMDRNWQTLNSHFDGVKSRLVGDELFSI